MDIEVVNRYPDGYREKDGPQSQVPDELRQLTTELDDVDLEARKEKERGDSQGGRGAQDRVAGELFEIEGRDDPNSETGERGREAETL